MNTDKLVLLFYDGFERRAEPEFLPRLKAEARRHARYAYRRLRKKQLRSGFYTWFFMLREALERSGYNVRVNDFALARKLPDHPIGVVGFTTVHDKIKDLPNPRAVGPGSCNSPFEVKGLKDDPRNAVIIETCDWLADATTPLHGERPQLWFGGFDTARFPDAKQHEKTYDVLIYDKIYFERDTLYPQAVEPFIALLEDQGLSYTTIRYGAYTLDDYLSALKASRSIAYFAHSETQGMACQEALAMNVPVFAWDQGVWMDPVAKQFFDEPVPCTSVPYFDERCGERFQIGNIAERWNAFWARHEDMAPRAFVADTLTFEGSADAYMSAYRMAGERGVRE